MIKVIPAILTNNTSTALEQIRLVDGVVDRISIDIIDGRFADNKTIDPLVVSEVVTQMKMDFQLMVFEPINWVDKCITARADRIIGHVEFMGDQKDFITKVKENGARVGLGLDLNTPFNKISSEVLGHLDLVLVMSVKAGFSSQKFEESTYKKITEILQARTMGDYGFALQVDGGVDKEIAKKLDVMGVDEVSMTSKIFDGSPTFNLSEVNRYLTPQ